MAYSCRSTATYAEGRGNSFRRASIYRTHQVDQPRQGRHRIQFVIGQNFGRLLRIYDASGNKWRLRPDGKYCVADSPGTGDTSSGAGTRSLCGKGFRVRFAASLAQELIEARDEKRLMRFRKVLAAFELLIVDGLDFVRSSKNRRRPCARGLQPMLRTSSHLGNQQRGFQ